jgi:ABC-type branched-subunit amino acid transport system ATPase component
VHADGSLPRRSWLGVSDDVPVLEFGEMIFEGTPIVVQSDAAVQTAYLAVNADTPA